MRRPHLLSSNKRQSFPTDILVFDTETDPIPISATETKHVLDFGWLLSQRQRTKGVWTKHDWARFTTAEEFWDLVERRLHGHTRLDIFCHNAAFDLPVVDAFNLLKTRGWTLQTAIVDSPPTICIWRKNKQTIRVVDTLNIWRMSLAEIGKNVRLKKFSLEESKNRPARFNAYCRRDVRILWKALHAWWRFLQSHNLGSFAPTLASQALRAYRYRFLSHPIYIDDNEKACALARQALHGGRTEAWRIGTYDGTFYQLDVNSMYPFVMQREEYPNKLMSVYTLLPLDHLQSLLPKYQAIADVTVETPEPVYSTIHEDRLIFPTGRFRCSLTTPELMYGFEHGYIKDLHQVALYEHAPIFRAFVDECYALRMHAKSHGDTVTTWQIKILMNSLYGKFAQRGNVFEHVDTTDSDEIKSWTEIDAVTGKIYKWRQFGGCIQQRTEQKEAHDSHPAIAAHVTAYARMYLWRLIQTAGPESVYYMDTDSLLVDENGYQRLRDMIDPDGLGCIKLESIYHHIEIRGAKDYRFDERDKVKGVRKSAVWIDASTCEQEHFSTLHGLIRRGDLSAPIVTRVRKHLSRRYTKGTVDTTGVVHPLTLSS